MNGTWKTGGGGGGDGLGLIAVIVAAAFAICAVIGAIGHAIAEIPLYVYVCAVAVVVAIVAGLVTLVVRVQRAEHRRAEEFTASRAAQFEAQREQRRVAAQKRQQAIEAPQQHIHFHGMTPQDVAAVLAATRQAEEIPR